MSSYVIQLENVERRFGETAALENISWQVKQGEHWVVLGPNGSGKSTLLQIAGLHLHPSSGDVTVLDHQLGQVDIRQLKSEVGFVSASLSSSFRSSIMAYEVVMTALYGALEPWWHTYSNNDHARACLLLEQVGCGDRANHTFGILSSGEKQRVLLARSLMTDPELVLLDEPTAGLDLGGREELLSSLTALASDSSGPSVVLVTHHVEDIPQDFTHAALMSNGQMINQGDMKEVMNEENLSECFDLKISLLNEGGRYFAKVLNKS